VLLNALLIGSILSASCPSFGSFGWIKSDSFLWLNPDICQIHFGLGGSVSLPAQSNVLNSFIDQNIQLAESLPFFSPHFCLLKE
jgi:hypothetical protein